MFVTVKAFVANVWNGCSPNASCVGLTSSVRAARADDGIAKRGDGNQNEAQPPDHPCPFPRRCGGKIRA